MSGRHDPIRLGGSAINRVVEDDPRGGDLVQSINPSVEARLRRRLGRTLSQRRGPEIA